MVYRDFAACLRLRREHLPHLDTYLAFFMPHELVVIEVTESGWSRFDIIPTSASSTFVEACGMYDPFSYGEIGMLV